MPTPKESAASLLAAKEALQACKRALMPKGLKHPTIAETDADAYGGVVIDRQAYNAAMRKLVLYERDVDALGGKNAADVAPPPEDFIEDADALVTALAELSA